MATASPSTEVGAPPIDGARKSASLFPFPATPEFSPAFRPRGTRFRISLGQTPPFPSRFQREESRFRGSTPRFPIPARGRETRNGSHHEHLPPSIHVRIAPRPPWNLHSVPTRLPSLRPGSASPNTPPPAAIIPGQPGPWSPLTGFAVIPNPQSGSLSIEIPADLTPPHFFRVVAERISTIVARTDAETFACGLPNTNPVVILIRIRSYCAAVKSLLDFSWARTEGYI
jgi:hypothetical protein